jgi:dTDP-L-rhamnose 4-epimerase
MRVLITGGAGFIGSHLSLLLNNGYGVRILDNLAPQAHGLERRGPPYLSGDAELVVAEVHDGEAVERVLRGVHAVVHLAAAIGVGRTMYGVSSYVGTDELGTAVLLEAVSRYPVAEDRGDHTTAELESRGLVA